MMEKSISSLGFNGALWLVRHNAQWWQTVPPLRRCCFQALRRSLRKVPRFMQNCAWIKQPFFLSAQRGFLLYVCARARVRPVCSCLQWPSFRWYIMHFYVYEMWRLFSKPLRSRTVPPLVTLLLRGPWKLITPSVPSMWWHPAPFLLGGEKAMRHPPSAALKATTVSIGTDVKAIRYDAAQSVTWWAIIQGRTLEYPLVLFRTTFCFIPHLCLPCLRSSLLPNGRRRKRVFTSERSPTFIVWSASRSSEVEINGCVSIWEEGLLLSTKGRHFFFYKVLKWVEEGGRKREEELMWVSTFGGKLKERTRWGGR